MFLSLDDQTIIAQCTPHGSGAIALLRICGINSIEIAEQCAALSSGKKLKDQATHTIHHGYVIDEKSVHVDEVMFLLMRGPKTFTGQDTIEITCHNNPFITEKIIERAIQCGARLAQKGEFTKRAVLNNKLDLVQAEAINELIHANTQMALKKSLAQLGGSLSDWLHTIEKQLIKALAFSESSFEFIDEENMQFGEQIKGIIGGIQKTIDSLKKTFDQQQHIRQGIRIAIVGSVNAGKSSLFNALLNKERAIVTNIAGTTRDVIEAGMYINGNYWTLVDTAGLRQANDVIEQEGIKRSFDEAKKADIVLLVFDGSQKLTTDEQKVYENLSAQHEKKIIQILNKSDEMLKFSGEASKMLHVSSKHSKNIHVVEKAIQEKISSLFAAIESPFLLNQRQFNLLLGLEKHLAQIINMLGGDIQYELLSFHLNDALAHLCELTGKTISEKGMDAVFREFCVGK